MAGFLSVEVDSLYVCSIIERINANSQAVFKSQNKDHKWLLDSMTMAAVDIFGNLVLKDLRLEDLLITKACGGKQKTVIKQIAIPFDSRELTLIVC